MDPAAPVQTNLTSGDMRPPEEMPAYLETVSSSQQQASPYPDPYINQQQTPHPEQPQVIVQTGFPPVGPEPVPLICPACKESVYTSVKKASSPLSYICCILMCSVGCCFYSCLPFCLNDFTVYRHTCPNCRTFIGTYRS